MEQPNQALLREIIYHTEAILKQTYARPPISTDAHTAAYPEMRQDATIAGTMEGIYSEILAREWFLSEDSKGQTRLDSHSLVDQLEGIELRDRLRQGLLGLERGFAVHELTWKYSSISRGMYLLWELADVNPDQIGFNVDDQMRIQSVVSDPYNSQMQTISLDKVWLHRHHPSRRFPAGQSHLEAAYRPWYSKDQLLKLLGLQLQRFGMAHYICQVPDSTSQITIDTVRNALYNLRIDGVAILPDSIVINRQDPAFATGMSFELAIQLQIAEIKQALLLDTASAALSGNSYARGDALVQENKAGRYGKTMWAWELCSSFRRQVLAPLVRANDGPNAPVPYLHLQGITDTDPDAASDREGAMAAAAGQQKEKQPA